MPRVSHRSPWAIENALGILEESRQRCVTPFLEDEEKGAVAEAMGHALDLAVSVVEGLNEMEPPKPPSPEEVANRAVRAFAGHMATALEELASGMRDIADGRMDQAWHDPWKD